MPKTIATETVVTYAMWHEYANTEYATVIRKGYTDLDELMGFKGVYESQGWLIGIFNDVTGERVYGTPIPDAA